MRYILAILLFASALNALSGNYKVVLGVFSTETDAQNAYRQQQNDPESVIERYGNEPSFLIHYRNSGDRFIITAEPFSNPKNAQVFLNKIRSIAPHAFVSQGVADNIEPLLHDHRELIHVSSDQILTDSPLPTDRTPTKHLISQPEVSEPTSASQSSMPGYVYILFGSIILLAGLLIRSIRLSQTHKKNYQAEKSEKESIKNSLQAKNDFIAMMSHEVRAPINAIKGISHLILETPLSPQLHNQVSKIQDASSILLTLVNDILDHSKIEAGKITIEQIPFDLNALLDDISNIVLPKAIEKNIDIIFDVDRSVPNKLIGDPLKLLQVLVNLLGNAVKFTSTGSVILRVASQQINRINLKLTFEVIDTGIGMNEEQIHKLFHSYAQGDDTVSRKYGGTGLGLVISKNLITLMGGSISVKSVPGQGSTFSFDVKLHSDLEYEKRRYRLPTKELMCKNVMILDNNSENIAALQRGLEYFHYEVKGFTNSNEALKLLETCHFDMIFVDTRLVLGGEFKKLLQSKIRDNDLKIVWFGEDVRKTGGAILRKPFNQLHVLNIILSVFGFMDQNQQQQNNIKTMKTNLKKFADRTILLAEDNEINSYIISGLLNGTDIRILSAANGQEAVDMVESHPEISVILMDIQLPILDGFEAAKQIRKNPQRDTIPIIAVTGNTLDSDIQHISEAGMNGHIAKPIDVKTFYTTLYYAFEKSPKSEESIHS